MSRSVRKSSIKKSKENIIDQIIQNKNKSSLEDLNIPYDHPILKSFLVDPNYSCSYYNVRPIQWYLDRKKDGSFIWKTIEPGVGNMSFPSILTNEDLDKIPLLLINLAQACGLSFNVEASTISKLRNISHAVLSPIGDTRIKGEVILETATLTNGTFLLLPEPELFGLISVFLIDKQPHYGLTVFELPRVVRLSNSQIVCD